MKGKTILLLWLSCFVTLNAVTFRVTAPQGTKECYIAGAFTSWSASDALKMTSDGDNTFYLDVPDLSSADVAQGYKYLSGKDWAYVEKGANGEEVSNRTVAEDNDIVLQWAKLYNPDAISEKVEKVVFNNFPGDIQTRTIQILTPQDYKTNPDKHYPVLYLQGIKQAYNAAGQDGENGDNFFSDSSWNIGSALEQFKAEGKEIGIIVAVYGYISDFSPWQNDDFMGSGKGDEYIDFFVNDIVPYVNANYRTLTEPQNTAIAGSDMGGLISYYAALKYQNKFGKVALFSPSFWFNKNNLSNYVNTWTKSNESSKMYFIAGDKEGTEFSDNTKLFYELTKAKGFTDDEIIHEVYKGGTHNDVSWGKQFGNIYSFLLDQEYSPGTGVDVPENYRFMSAITSAGVACDADAALEESNYYPKSANGVSKNAKLYVKEIPTNVQSNFYWNLNIGNDCLGGKLFAENKTIGFSNKKQYPSWLRTIVFEDKTTEDVVASSAFFRVVKGDGLEVVMSRTKADGTSGSDDSYTVSAIVSFSAASKAFSIFYGSVNSGSKMEALTHTVNISDNCIEAQIIYCFKTNQVTVICIGNEPPSPLDDYRFMSAQTSAGVACDVDAALEEGNYYPKGANGVSKNAKLYVKEIPVSVQGSFYWNLNIGDDCSGSQFFTENKTIGFSNKKQYISWLRTIVFDDKTTEDVAVSSAFFRVVKGDNSEVVMSRTNADGTPGSDNSYTVSAEVSFSAASKAFSVFYGSVNSGSKMEALTHTLNVSNNCIEAQIIYCFKTNQVTIRELEFNPEGEVPSVTSLKAIPSLCKAGTPVSVSASIKNMEGYDVSYLVSYNYGTEYTQSATVNEKGEYVFNIQNPLKGIYHITLVAKKDGSKLDDLPTICVKVPYDSNNRDVKKTVTVNAYEKVDWGTVGKYKGNFHTHTSLSFDTDIKPDKVVDLYHEKDYKILALTDHDANIFPWAMFNSFNSDFESRSSEQLDMLTFPAIELSKDNRNNWNEIGGGEFNHHNDFFTGRKGQEFATLQESYAYTQKIGGLQIINHPGQYWSLDKEYNNASLERNSPAWHANNFINYESLIGLEVYNQGNRRPNDRILWDQILDLTMPERPVWGYSSDDSHNLSQYFRNYQFILMTEFSIAALKDAMKAGSLYFSYEYGGSGNALAPMINNVTINNENETITIDTPDQDVYWISSTDMKDTPGSRKSSVIGYGKTFCHTGFQGKYVRALIKNQYGETCTQPFGFEEDVLVGVTPPESNNETADFLIYPNPAKEQTTVRADSEIETIGLFNLGGVAVKKIDANNQSMVIINLHDVPTGMYVVKVKTKIFTKSKLIMVVSK